jgi:hypothetical protein
VQWFRKASCTPGHIKEVSWDLFGVFPHLLGSLLMLRFRYVDVAEKLFSAEEKII